MLTTRHRLARNPYFHFHPFHSAFSVLGARGTRTRGRVWRARCPRHTDRMGSGCGARTTKSGDRQCREHGCMPLATSLEPATQLAAKWFNDATKMVQGSDSKN